MHDLGYLISALSTLIGTLYVAYQAWGKNKRDTRNDTIREMRSEREEQKANTEMYRKRWLEAEKRNDELREELEKLRKENKK